jgi:hypothetical protein
MSRKKQCSLTLPRWLVDRIDELADREALSRSAVVEGLCTDALGSDAAMTAMTANPIVWQAFMKSFASPGVVAAMVEAFKGDADVDPHQLEIFADAMQDTARHQVDAARTPDEPTPRKKPQAKKTPKKKPQSRKKSPNRKAR